MYLKKLSILVAGTAMFVAQAASAQTNLVWWVMNWSEEKATAYAETFMAENPDINVRIEQGVYGGLRGRVLVAIQSGNVPDLIDLPNGLNIPLAQTGGLAPLGDALKSMNVDFGDILTASVDTATFEGQIYGLPYQAEAHAFVYNKQAYRDAGLDPEQPPQTWPQFLEYSQKLTGEFDGQQRYGYGLSGGGPDQPGNALFRALPFLWMNGGGILGADQKTVILDSPESVEAVKFYTELYTKYAVAPPSTLENDSAALRRLFSVGTISQIPAATSDVGRVKEANPDLDIGVGILPHPEGKETAVILGGWNFVVPADSKNQEAALKLVEFMSDPDRQANYTTTFPAAQSGLLNERFTHDWMDAHKEMLTYARPQPTIPEWAEISQVFYNYLQECLLGADVQESMTAAAEQIRGILVN